MIIESPCFFDNIQELAEYLQDLEIAGMLVAYHGAGATFMPEAPKYATANAVEYSQNGGGKALIDNFTAAFGDSFDSSVHQITNIIGEGPITIGRPQFHYSSRLPRPLISRFQRLTLFILICWGMTVTPLWPELLMLMLSLISLRAI